MSHLLIVYTDRVPTVDLVTWIVLDAAKEKKTEILEKKISNLERNDLEWCDTILCIRPYDIACTKALKAAKKSGRKIVIYLDDDLLNLPNLYCGHVRRVVTEVLKSQNQRALREALSICDVLWGSSPVLIEKYRLAAGKARAALADVATDISDMNDIKNNNTEKTFRFLFAGGIDHANFLNKYIIPAMNRLDTGKRDVEFVCMGVRVEDLKNCKILIRNIPWISDYEQYRKTIKQITFDVGIAVIDNGSFYECKYYNKFIEYGLLGVSGLYTDSAPYSLIVKDGINGFLAENSVEGWTRKMQYTLDHPDKCRECAINAQYIIRSRFSKNELVKGVVNNVPELFLSSVAPVKCVKYRKSTVWNNLRTIGGKALQGYENVISRRK